jgi:hypothetical protein
MISFSVRDSMPFADPSGRAGQSPIWAVEPMDNMPLTKTILFMKIAKKHMEIAFAGSWPFATNFLVGRSCLV